MGTSIEPETVLKIFYQAAKGVGHMHAQATPIVHRDIKVRFFFSFKFSMLLKNNKKYPLSFQFQIENFLLGEDGTIKLCDFGSATTDVYSPDMTWSAQQRDTLEDQVNFEEILR